MAATFRYIMLLTRDVAQGVKFYQEGLGLQLKHCTDRWAEFHCGGTVLSLKRVESEASASKGYSPLLCFAVPDFDAAIARLMKNGAVLDGPIKYPVTGKVASLRSPDGHMIGLYEELQQRSGATPPG